ncbi:MAG: ABC transporter ATP-binding protein/permease [Anaerolineae bacterium]|nr:ABC transporter ATP-binding protein/permease [Anaerolineae bacterium]
MMDRQAQFFGQETRKARSVRGTLRRLWHYFRHYSVALVLVAILLVASTYMQVLIPNLTGQAVDCYLGPYSMGAAAGEGMAAMASMAGNTESDAFSNCWYTTPDITATKAETLAGFGGLILLIVGLYFGSAIFSGLMFYIMSWAGYRVMRDLQAQIFAHIHQLSLGYFTKHEAGDVMSRITNDTDTLQQIIGFGLVAVFQSALTIVWVIVVMFRLNAPYALISLITLPFMVIVTRWFSNKARQAFRKARVQIGNVNADLQESISSVREVQAFSREDENIEQFRASNAANRDANIRAQAYTGALGPMLEGLGYISLAVVAVVGGLLMLSGRGLMGTTVSVGLIITFIGYSQQFNRPVQQISTLWASIQSALAGAERIFGLLDDPVDIVDSPNARAMPPIVGHVVYDNVFAEYNPGEPILRGISIDAQPGQTIAIVGPTGAGKTTIINLLPRFWEVSSGSVTIDGTDIREVTQESLRRQIGIVLQDSFLFSDTVMNNIRYGRPEASEEEVMAAARLAHAHEFISRLPNGYETVLGERGGGLSQGQRQLLSIARVALIDPRILILDEATSSVDTRTEREIQKALEDLLHGRTSFVIAHRLSTIRHADQVLVVRDGQIIERGTHDQLLADRGFYYNLYMSQFRRSADGNAEPEDLAHLQLSPAT